MCTEEGFGEIVRPRTHVYVATKLLYASGVPSDRRAPAYEPMLVSHIEATADAQSTSSAVTVVTRSVTNGAN